MGPISRREFVRLGTVAAAAGAAAKSILLEPAVLAAPSGRKIRSAVKRAKLVPETRATIRAASV